MSNLLSRKFIISVLCLCMVFTGFMMNKIPSDLFLSFVIGIQSVYTGANIISERRGATQ